MEWPKAALFAAQLSSVTWSGDFGDSFGRRGDWLWLFQSSCYLRGVYLNPFSLRAIGQFWFMFHAVAVRRRGYVFVRIRGCWIIATCYLHRVCLYPFLVRGIGHFWFMLCIVSATHVWFLFEGLEDVQLLIYVGCISRLSRIMLKTGTGPFQTHTDIHSRDFVLSTIILYFLLFISTRQTTPSNFLRREIIFFTSKNYFENVETFLKLFFIFAR